MKKCTLCHVLAAAITVALCIQANADNLYVSGSGGDIQSAINQAQDGDTTAIYVSDMFGDDAQDGTSWASAKKSIQAGIDAQSITGGCVVVSNGVYSSENFPISVKKHAVTIKSVNGPEVTIINAEGTATCIALYAEQSSLVGFTVTGGRGDGSFDSIYVGGIHCAAREIFIKGCIVTNNFGYYNGGMSGGTAISCVFTHNKSWEGRALGNGVAVGSVFAHNFSEKGVAGINNSVASNCTITANRSLSGAGGVGGESELYNCIVWGNSSDQGNSSDLYVTTCVAKFTCSPDLTHGVDGNITANPQLITTSQLFAESPCIAVGSSTFASGVDIDGEFWQSTPSMGCSQYRGEGNIKGEISLSFAGPTEVSAGYAPEFAFSAYGPVTRTVVDFGDTTTATNPVLNGSDANSGTSWAEAKATINAGVDAQKIIGGRVLVADGSYGAVGSYYNPINVPIRLSSVNGPTNTTIQGDGTDSCLTIGDVKAIVSGFTIRGGKANKGAGVSCKTKLPMISNCVITECETSGLNRYGGGISEGDAYNCTIIYNVCGTASRGGGVQGKSDKYATIYNCIIYGNTTKGSPENIRYVNAYNSCSPDFAPGVNPNITSVRGNITSAPAFANPAIGDYSLLITSPCINAGDNAFVSPDHNQDYDSQSRISGKMVDIGAYEYQLNVPFLSVSKQQIHQAVAEGQSPRSSSFFDVFNSGDVGTMNYSVVTNAGWLSCTPTSGSCTDDERDTITVIYDTAALPLGTNTAEVTISSSAAGSPRVIRVTLEVYTPKFDHLAFSAIAPTQTSNEPFAVTLEALDHNGYRVASYNPEITLAAYAVSNVVLGVLSPSAITMTNGVWSEMVTIAYEGRIHIQATNTADGAFALSNPFDITEDGRPRDSDGDGVSDADELVAGTNPNDANDYFRIITATQTTTGIEFVWDHKEGRRYSLYWTSDLSQPFALHTAEILTKGSFVVPLAADVEPQGFYKLKVEKLPTE